MFRLKPSKRIVPVLFACVMAVGIIIFAADYSKTDAKKDDLSKKNTLIAVKNAYPSNNSIDLSDSYNQAANLDDNNDGITNWEETLNKIGANNSSASSYDIKNLTETDKLSVDLFAKYVDAKKKGTLDKEEFVQEFVDKQISIEETPAYTLNDISIDQRPATEETLRDYAEKFEEILAKYPITDLNNEDLIISKALDERSQEALNKVGFSITRYQNIVSELKLLDAPKDIALYHLAFLNNFSAVANDLEGIKKILSDPIVGLVSVNKYKNHVDLLIKTQSDLGDFFLQFN